MESLPALGARQWAETTPELLAGLSVRRAMLREHPAAHPAPDEPLAVVTVGPGGTDRRALLAGLLGAARLSPQVPPESFLVLRYAPNPAANHRSAVGTSRAASSGPADRAAPSGPADRAGTSDDPALIRPPRRVEWYDPDPLLRHFLLIDTPDTGTLGVAGVRVVRDAVRRGGALLYVLPAHRSVTAADVDLLTEVAGEAAVFLVSTPGGDGGWSSEPDGTTYPKRVEAQRAGLLARVPALDGLAWHELNPAAGDTAYLRHALIDWASAEGLRRASLVPPVVPGFGRTVPVAARAHLTGWADRLDREVRTCVHQLRRDIALETANIHLRGVREVVSGSGCPGLPGFLDRELEALSLDVMAACDAELDRILGESLALVFGEPPDDGVRLRAAAAVNRGLAVRANTADRANTAARANAADLRRALLVRADGAVDPLDDPPTVAALASYPGGTAAAILPPLGVGLVGECHTYWRRPEHADADRARSWLRRALREVELELSREVSRRLAAFGAALAMVLADAIQHGRLRG